MIRMTSSLERELERDMGNRHTSASSRLTEVAYVKEQNGQVHLSNGASEVVVTQLSPTTMESNTPSLLPGIADEARTKENDAVSKDPPAPLPSLAELLGDFTSRFLLCANCQNSLDEELHSPKRLACCHAVCSSCMNGSQAARPPQCQRCQSEGKMAAEEGETERRGSRPDLTRLKMLELVWQYEGAATQPDEQDALETEEFSVRFLEQLVEELLTCAICQSLMEGPDRSPCLLPCNHSLCLVCLDRLAPQSSSGRCHECRQDFRSKESCKDDVLDSLLHWVMTFREHVTNLTPQLDDVSARMYSLQEVLAAKEQKVTEGSRVWQLMQLLSVAVEGAEPPQVLQGWKELADVCLTIVKETRTLGLQSSKDVWSTAKLAYTKLLVHSAERNGFSEALVSSGAVEVLTETCGHQPFIDNMAAEQVSHAVNHALATLSNICCEEIPNLRQLYLENHTAEVASRLVSADNIESMVTHYALKLLRKIFSVLENDRRHTVDSLDLEGLPGKLVQVLRALHEKGFEDSIIAWETARMVYNTMHNYSLGERFSKSLAREGAVALLTHTCTMRKYLDEISNQDYNYAIEASLAALFNLAFEDGVEVYFKESKTVETLCDLVAEQYMEKGVSSGAMNVLAKLYQRQGAAREDMGNTVTSKGLPESLLRMAECYTKTITDVGSSKAQCVKQAYSHMWDFSGTSAAFAKALADGGVVKLATENCTHQPFLDNSRSEVTAYLLRASVAILHNIWNKAGFQMNAEETQALQALCGLVSVENATNGVAGFVMAVLQMLYNNYTSRRAAVGNVLAGEGMAVTLVTFVKSFGEWVPLTSDTLAAREATYSILWNFSDASDLMAKELARTGAVEFLTATLRPRASLKEAPDETTATVIKSSIAILQNIARRPGCRLFFEESKTAEVLVPFVTSEDDVTWRLAAYTAVAFMVDAQDPCLVTDGELIRHLRKLLLEALQSAIRRCEGFSTLELMEYIAQLSLHHAVRSQFLEADIMPLLEKLIESENADETATALLCKERLQGEITNT